MSKDGDFFLGDICEIIVYDSRLSTPDMRTVRRLLRAKWDLGRAWAGKLEGEPIEPSAEQP